MTILVIEDEQKLVDILKKALTAERFGVDSALDGEEGLAKALKKSYALIILDLMLPKKDGVEVCRELRARQVHTPIIMLTARGTIADRVSGLDVGADDYLVKPFGIDELLARIRAVLRRRKVADPVILKAGDLVVDVKKHEVTRAGTVVSLTPKEYRLLQTLLMHRGQAMTRRELLDNVWGPDFIEGNNELNVHMAYLRRKIDAGHAKPLLHTVRSVGYALDEQTR